MDMRAGRRAIDKIYKRRDRYEIPDWQREEVWNADKQRKLIDTVLRGWKLPKFYFQKTSENPDQFDVVDGQQRLNALWEFLDGNLVLSPDTAQKFGGSTYDELPEAISDSFDDYEIEYDEITNATEDEVREFFQRLQEGVSLNSSEKLNAVTSKLRDYCVRIAKHKFFSETTAVANKRYGHFDVAAKVVALELEGLDAGLRYDDVKKVFVDNASFSSQSAVAKRVNKALDTLVEKLPTPFSRLRNRTIVQSVVTFTCHLLQAGVNVEQGSTLKNFIEYFLSELSRQVELGQQSTDPDFIAFQRTVNANIRSGARTRQSILLRKLFQKHPEVFSSISHSADLADGLRSDVIRLGASIRDLISISNERYAGTHGRDLFKPTNKSATAIMSLSKSVASFEDYKAFVEHLYFIFRESTGQRLVDELPASFKDVNDLRTMIQHDVDHGKAGKAAAKRKALAAVFAKYAGSSSPEAVDPSNFLLVQSNILGALESDLHVLAKSLA